MQGLSAPSADPPAEAVDRFQQLYGSAGTAVLGYALRRCATREDALDVTAETFLVVWRRREDMPAELDEARAWLFGVARLCLSNLTRSERRSARLGERLAATMDVASLPDPALLQEVRADSRIVRSALAELSPDDRELVTLIAWEGLSTVQAAAVLGLTPGAARVRLHRARLRLRATLTPAPSQSKDQRP